MLPSEEHLIPEVIRGEMSLCQKCDQTYDECGTYE